MSKTKKPTKAAVVTEEFTLVKSPTTPLENYYLWFHRHLAHAVFDQLSNSAESRTKSYELISIMFPELPRDDIDQEQFTYAIQSGTTHFAALDQKECKQVVAGLLMICNDLSTEEAWAQTNEFFEQAIKLKAEDSSITFDVTSSIVPKLSNINLAELEEKASHDIERNKKLGLEKKNNNRKSETPQNKKALEVLHARFKECSDRVFGSRFEEIAKILDSEKFSEKELKLRIKELAIPATDSWSKEDQEGVCDAIFNAIVGFIPKKRTDFHINLAKRNASRLYINHVGTKCGQYNSYIIRHQNRKEEEEEISVAPLAISATAPSSSKAGDKKKKKQEEDDLNAIAKQEKAREKTRNIIISNLKNSKITNEIILATQNQILEYVKTAEPEDPFLFAMLYRMVEFVTPLRIDDARQNYFDEAIVALLNKFKLPTSINEAYSERLSKEAFRQDSSGYDLFFCAHKTLINLIRAKFAPDVIERFVEIYQKICPLDKKYALGVTSSNDEDMIGKTTVYVAYVMPEALLPLIKKLQNCTSEEVTSSLITALKSKSVNQEMESELGGDTTAKSALVKSIHNYPLYPEVLNKMLELIKSKQIDLSKFETAVVQEIVNTTISSAPKKLGDILALIKTPAPDLKITDPENSHSNLKFYKEALSRPELSEQMKSKIRDELAAISVTKPGGDPSPALTTPNPLKEVPRGLVS